MTTLEQEVTADQEVFTRQEFAERLKVSEAAIRLWESQGKLHSLRFGKLVRIPRSELERILRYGVPA